MVSVPTRVSIAGEDCNDSNDSVRSVWGVGARWSVAGRLESAHDVAGSTHCAPLASFWRDRFGSYKMSKIFDNIVFQAVDLSNLGTIIRERREALGLTQSRLARLSGLSRQTLVGLEAGALSDLGFNRVAQVLAVLGLDLDPPSSAARSRKRGLWMAAKNASVSYVQEVPPDTLSHALVSGSVPKGYVAHLTHLLDEAPVPLVVMAVEEAAANEGVAPKAVWRNVAKLARSLAVHRQGLWA
jgi:transcriptional regulator with XRE-family HTH domain